MHLRTQVQHTGRPPDKSVTTSSVRNLSRKLAVSKLYVRRFDLCANSGGNKPTNTLASILFPQQSSSHLEPHTQPCYQAETGIIAP
mmetsp:Transcript_23252/g.53982  ORF Transcript_23252/g.53982 Transcript_23252/m.53982 type:complete len:86 (-) Transcript_23252:83-340(-)